MSIDSKKEKGKADWRRPLGCGVLSLDKDLVSLISAKETEFTIPFFSVPQEAQQHLILQRKMWWGWDVFEKSQVKKIKILSTELIKKTPNMQETQKAKGVCVGLTLFAG